MQVKKLIILALSLSILSLCAYAQGKTITVEQAAREAVSEDDLRAAVDSLCSKEFGGRATGTQGAKACREYIGRSFRENGATVTDMEFPCPDGPGHDIIAFHCTNKVSPPSSYIVIMAYYDGLGSLNGKTYPGADSNASGVSVAPRPFTHAWEAFTHGMPSLQERSPRWHLTPTTAQAREARPFWTLSQTAR